jgi:uncharacterized protein YndB with AHSA1/START domain
VRIVFEAWTKPELLRRWWAPKSSGLSLLSCEADVRVGSRYRFEFGHEAAPKPMASFGRYLEVTPHSRLVWTNEESEDGAVTTVAFGEKGGKTLLVMHDAVPRRKLSMPTAGRRVGCPRRSRNWTSFSSPWVLVRMRGAWVLGLSILSTRGFQYIPQRIVAFVAGVFKHSFL